MARRDMLSVLSPAACERRFWALRRRSFSFVILAYTRVGMIDETDFAGRCIEVKTQAVTKQLPFPKQSLHC
jgi:hypothetical protein